VLSPDLLERAAALARRPFDREAIRARAVALGVPSSERRGKASARALLALGPGFDAPYTLDWLRRILEPRDERLARFEAMLRAEEGA
jgi:hypothetical protein